MIEYIKGSLVELRATQAVVETTGGVAYVLNISLQTYTAVQGSTEVKLYAEEVIREDAHLLYGFATLGERAMYRALLSVSGVGPSSARTMLSAHSAAELQGMIAGGDVASLKSVKGIGQKTAERLVVELREKVQKVDLGAHSPSVGGAPSPAVAIGVRQEALDALEVMGYNKAAAQKAVEKILSTEPGLSVQDILRKAFSML